MTLYIASNRICSPIINNTGNLMSHVTSGSTIMLDFI